MGKRVQIHKHTTNKSEDLKFLCGKPCEIQTQWKSQSFPCLLNKFSPKRISFTYEGMIARTQLAILDHNCGVSLKQILDEQGEGKTINTQYTKVTAHHVAKKVMKPKDKNYIKEIIRILRGASNE